jgi:hypothetical protein
VNNMALSEQQRPLTTMGRLRQASRLRQADGAGMGGNTDNTKPNTSGGAGFNTDELTALNRLRTRYDESRDAFSAEEKARLEFLRWLYRSGKLSA